MFRMSPPSPPWLPPPDVDTGEFTWTELVLYVSCVVAVASVLLLCTTGNLLTVNENTGDISCRPQCGLSIFPTFGGILIRTAHRAHARIKGTPLEGVKAAQNILFLATISTKLALNFTAFRHCTFCKAIYAPRRQFGATLRRLLDDAKMPLRVSATEAIDKHGADSAAAKRSIDLADTVDVMCDAAHAAARDLLMRTYGEKISVPQVTTHALLAALQTTRLGTTIGLQAEQALTAALHTKLPEPVAGTIATDTKLSAIVASVWAKLLRQCIAEKRLQPVLQRLVNGLIDAQALQPIHTLWLRALFFSGLWLFLLLSGSAAWHVVLSNSRAGDRLDVLAAEFNITYRILMTLLLVLVVIAQLKFIERFLKWRAQRVAHELSASLERTLLDLVVDDEILEFVRFVVDTAVEVCALSRVPSDLPTQSCRNPHFGDRAGLPNKCDRPVPTAAFASLCTASHRRNRLRHRICGHSRYRQDGRLARERHRSRYQRRRRHRRRRASPAADRI